MVNELGAGSKNDRLSPLSDMRPGERGIVHACNTHSELIYRMQEMGLLPGTPVRFIRRAPLGDPLEIEIRGYLLSLRRKDAADILVAVNGNGNSNS